MARKKDAARLPWLTASDIPAPEPEVYPKVYKHRYEGWVIDFTKEHWMHLSKNPRRVFQVLHHISSKTWCTARMLHLAIERVFGVFGWDLFKGEIPQDAQDAR